MANKIKKLLKKIGEKDRRRLMELIEKLAVNETKGLDIIKVVNTDFYRLKSGKFRIIYHIENKEAVIDGVKLRNEKTYK